MNGLGEDTLIIDGSKTTANRKFTSVIKEIMTIINQKVRTLITMFERFIVVKSNGV